VPNILFRKSGKSTDILQTWRWIRG
jgi:hypothetical protein